eukprot:1229268-Pleurochrysis_carterae.AAC.1
MGRVKEEWRLRLPTVRGMFENVLCASIASCGKQSSRASYDFIGFGKFFAVGVGYIGYAQRMLTGAYDGRPAIDRRGGTVMTRHGEGGTRRRGYNSCVVPCSAPLIAEDIVGIPASICAVVVNRVAFEPESIQEGGDAVGTSYWAGEEEKCAAGTGGCA